MEQKNAQLLIETSLGNIKIRLYDDTPRHRDNILKLASEGFYDGTLFHRVIREFMIQGGDPDSKGAPAGKSLGAGDAGYTLSAEFNTQHFHKRGALAAARLGDQVNPNKDSSGCQFYIVTGKIYKPSTLKKFEKSINDNRENAILEKLIMKNLDTVKELRKARDIHGLQKLQDDLTKQAKAQAKEEKPFEFSPEQIEAYTTIGGTPFLDNEYTVYGEVTEGFEVLNAIEKVKTDRNDRPLEDLQMKILVL